MNRANSPFCMTGTPGDTPGNLVEVLCRPVLQILTLFQTKKCHFPHPFSDKTSKIHTDFQTWPLCRNYVILTQIRPQQGLLTANKKFFKCISNWHINFWFLFIWNSNDNYVQLCSGSSLENRTQFQTKMAKVYTRFQTKNQGHPTRIQFKTT